MGSRKNGENIIGSMPILKKTTFGNNSCIKLCLKCVSDTVQQFFLKTVEDIASKSPKTSCLFEKQSISYQSHRLEV